MPSESLRKTEKNSGMDSDLRIWEYPREKKSRKKETMLKTLLEIHLTKKPWLISYEER